MATPILCQQTTITYNGVTIGGVKAINGVASGTATEIDVTTLASTDKEFLMGLQDNGSFTIDLIRDGDDLGQIEMKDAKAAQEAKEVVITLPGSTNNVLTFDAFVLSLPRDIGADGVVSGTATLRITGGIVES